MNRLSFLSFILLAAMALHAQVNVVPRPQTITLDARQRTLSLASLEGIVTPADVDMMRNAQFLSDYTRLPVNNQLGKKAVALRLQINPKMTADEGYSITTSEHGITIEGRTPAGVFYGIQIVRQLWPGAQTLPLGTIASQPRFSYRGMHLDVVRHFFNKDVVKRYLDMMALHGMNMPLALNAYEAIIARVWKKMGLTDDEINGYFVFNRKEVRKTHLDKHKILRFVALLQI